MKLEDLTTIDQLEDFLSGTQAVAFSVISASGAKNRILAFRPLHDSSNSVYPQGVRGNELAHWLN